MGRLQVFAGVVTQAQFHALSRDGLLGCVRMPLDLVSDGGADEVGAVGVEPLLHQKVDMPEIDVAEVDRDLFGVASLGAELVDVVGHLTILLPSNWMVKGAHPGTSRAKSHETGTASPPVLAAVFRHAGTEIMRVAGRHC